MDSPKCCRFCGKYIYTREDGMVRYGIRHYAHPACYIATGRRLTPTVRSWIRRTAPDLFATLPPEETASDTR